MINIFMDAVCIAQLLDIYINLNESAYYSPLTITQTLHNVLDTIYV